MTNAEARFNKSLPEGSLGRTAQDVHLDSQTAPELCYLFRSSFCMAESWARNKTGFDVVYKYALLVSNSVSKHGA